MNGRTRLRRLLLDLRGRTEREIVESLAAQVGEALAATAVAYAAAGGRLSTSEARTRIDGVEQAGDRHRAGLVERLASTLVTPFDREDLYRLSRSIDDVVDNLRDFVVELDLFGIDAEPGCVAVIDAVGDGLRALDVAVAGIPARARSVPLGALATKKASNQIRRSYQIGVADLLQGPVTDDMLKRRELLRRLDVVGLRLGEAADALADGAVKRAW